MFAYLKSRRLLIGILAGAILLAGGISAYGIFSQRKNGDNQNQPGNFNSQSPGNSRDYAMAGGGGDSSTKDLPSCSTNTVFNHLPTSDIESIEGLGHTYGEHIIPVQADHIYLNTAQNNANVTVYAPGDVTLLQVVATTHTGGGDVGLGTDYTYFFSPCKSILFVYGHVKTVSDAVQKAIDAAKPKCDDSGTLATNCVYQDLNLKLTSGETIGTALGSGRALDFGAVDVRKSALGFINNQDLTGGIMADSYFHTVCPLDYFTSSFNTQLYAKLLTKNAGANGIPACGAVMQDKAGTSQGNWYMPGMSQTAQDDNLTKIMALVHYNLDPAQAVLSAGNKLLPSNDFGAQIIYTPNATGLINPDPSRIKPDGQVYCIDGQVTVSNQQGHVDLQMTDQSTLKADYATGNCTATPTLSTNAITYNR